MTSTASAAASCRRRRSTRPESRPLPIVYLTLKYSVIRSVTCGWKAVVTSMAASVALRMLPGLDNDLRDGRDVEPGQAVPGWQPVHAVVPALIGAPVLRWNGAQTSSATTSEAAMVRLL